MDGDSVDRLLQKILDLRKSRGWTEYRLVAESDVAQATISAWYNRNKNLYPTVASLKKIAKSFDVSMSFLLADGNTIEVTEQQMELLNKWALLDSVQRRALLNLLDTFVMGSN